MDYITFYDKKGMPIAWLSDKDNETIYLFNGKPVAWISGTSVYSFSGTHLGFYENGWIYDNNGYCVYYTQKASGGPVKPVKNVNPVRSVTKVKPVKSVKSVPPVRPVKKLSWSSNSENFFR